MYTYLSTPIWLLGAGKGKVKSHGSTKTYCQGRYSHVPSFLSTSDVCLCFSYYSYEIRNKHTHTEINILFEEKMHRNGSMHAQRTFTRIHTGIHALTCTQPSPLLTHTLSISLTDTNIRNYAVLFLFVLTLLSTCAHNGLLPALSIYICTRIYKGIKKIL